MKASTALPMGWPFLALVLGFAAITAMILAYYHHRMGCITGDMLGAMVEITEAGLFLLLAAMARP